MKLAKKPGLIVKEFGISSIPNDYGKAYEKWDMDKFIENFKIDIVRKNSKKTEQELEFDLIGIEAPFANAFRRLMISEVPSMAIDKVIIYNNSSIIPDEVLSHRLGLIPLKADPRKFEYRPEDATEGTEKNTLEFSLKIKCTHNLACSKSSAKPEDMYENSKVFSSQIKWHPIGNQSAIHKEEDIGPLLDDILIAKMKPGQEIDIHMIAVKGIGRNNAKFSPVATARYRMMPKIVLTRDVFGEDAELLKKCFCPGTIDIDKKGKAYVKNARYDVCNRNISRHEKISDAADISRRPNHFIFSVESVGGMSPEDIFLESVKILGDKCSAALELLNNNL